MGGITAEGLGSGQHWEVTEVTSGERSVLEPSRWPWEDAPGASEHSCFLWGRRTEAKFQTRCPRTHSGLLTTVGLTKEPDGLHHTLLLLVGPLGLLSLGHGVGRASRDVSVAVRTPGSEEPGMHLPQVKKTAKKPLFLIIVFY